MYKSLYVNSTLLHEIFANFAIQEKNRENNMTRKLSDYHGCCGQFTQEQ